jgi:hypothetical protein
MSDAHFQDAVTYYGTGGQVVFRSLRGGPMSCALLPLGGYALCFGPNVIGFTPLLLHRVYRYMYLREICMLFRYCAIEDKFIAVKRNWRIESEMC